MQGKALIITGSTGIAAATARLAAEAGALLTIATGDPDTGWALAAETGAECWVGELSLLNSAESVLGVSLARYGRVDAVFNAAGLSGRRFGDGPVHECSDEGWDITLQQNLRTTFQLCRAVIGRMLEQEVEEDGIRGSILNVGSVLAESPEPRHFSTHAYAAAKGAIVSMSRSMASYYAPHKIRVNVLAPGLVRTPASERSQANSEFLDFVEKKQPLAGGMVDAADVARVALFLLSPVSRFITGDVLTVDAGWSVTGA
jgi:NAD(P)-dependent dehydrogenase (short-subunit alcohol dehydrogenase family)